MAYEYKTNAQKAHKAKSQSGRIPREICEKRWYGKPCKFCNSVAKLMNGDEDDKTIAFKVKAKSTYYLNVIPLIKGGSKISDKVVKIYPSGISNWRDMIALLPDSDGDGVDFTDPDRMRPIILERKGKGRNTKYSLKLAENTIKIPEKFLGKMFKLHKLLDWIDDDDKFFIPEEGKNKFLVLPPWGEEADGQFWFEGFFHWNVDLLGGADDGFDDSDSSGFDDDSDGFADSGDESFSDDSSSDSFEDSSADDFEESTGGGSDDFEEFDEASEKQPSIDDMDQPAMVKLAKEKGINLSEKALKAPADKLRAFLKKKLEDVPW